MIRIGIIGAGGNGSGHARYYHECPRTEVVAVADPDMDRAGKLAEELGAHAVPDHRDFFGKVDAAVISSPGFLHREHAVDCTGAGLHIFCEKPMGLNTAEAQDIADAVDAAGVVCFVGFSVRFGGVVQTMKKRLEAGDVGDLVSLWSRRMTHRGPTETSPWRGDHTKSGGVLFELLVHEIEWLMALGGEVRSVYGRKWTKWAEGPRANDHIWATLNFTDRAVATHEGSWASPVPDYYRGLFGTKAGMRSTDWGQGLVFCDPDGDDVELELEDRFDKRAHFLDCIESKAESVADARWGLKVTRVADAILESAETDAVVQL